MAGMPIRGGFTEFQKETSFGNGIAAATDCEDFGLVNPYSATPRMLTEEIQFLGEEGQTSIASNYSQITVGGEIPSSIHYYLQTWDMLEFALGSATGFDDTVNTFATISGVEINSTWNYQVITGNAVETWNWKLPEFGLCSIDMGLICNDALDPTAVDPLTTGAHGAINSMTPYKWTDIVSLKLDANDPPTTLIPHFYSDVNINFTNTYDAPKDPAETTMTKIKGLVVLRRGVEITLDVKWVNYDWWDYMADETSLNFQIVIGDGTPPAKTFDIDNLRMLEFPRDFDPTKAIGGTVTLVGDKPTVTVA